MTHYFRDKETLITEVIAWQAQTVIDNHTQEGLGDLDSFEALDLWARLLMERQEEYQYVGGCQFGSLAGQLVEASPEIRPDLADGFVRLLELFRKGMRTMRERGELRSEAEPEHLANVLVSAMEGGLLLTQTLRRPESLSDALKGAIAYVKTFAADQRPPS